jgi:hypothetical protein
MNTKKAIPSLGALVLLLTFGFALGFQADISGTWVGDTEIPDQGVDEMTLVIEKSGESYTATISDSFGMVTDAECEDLEYKDNTLTFNISIFDGYSDMTVYITLKVDGDTMTGHWETEDGNTGEITMEKQTG